MRKKPGNFPPGVVGIIRTGARDIRRSLDTQADLLAPDPEDHDADIIPNHQAFPDLPGQDEHLGLPGCL
jgi:hypothetical protein